jgi:hypothetical protein
VTDRRVVVGLADLHAGHGLGLLNPDTRLLREDDQGNGYPWAPPPTETQRWLWGVYLAQIAALRDIAGDDEITVLVDGDATQGDRFAAGLIADVTRQDQQEIAVDALSPLVELDNVRKVRLLTGTAVHVPDSAEARISSMLAKSSGKDVQSSHHSRFTIAGVVFDVAHHGPAPGSRHWLRGNVALYYLRDRVYNDLHAGITPARVYVRAHFHEWAPAHLEFDFWDEVCMASLYVLPSMCGLTAYGRQATRSIPTLRAGFLAWEIVDGRVVECHRLTSTLDLRTEETL